jgi:hypothetical protein
MEFADIKNYSNYRSIFPVLQKLPRKSSCKALIAKDRILTTETLRTAEGTEKSFENSVFSVVVVFQWFECR